MIKEPWKYKGRIATEVAKELGMEIDNFLDELLDKAGYYCCPKCGEIVDIEQQDNNLDKKCDKCTARAIINSYENGVCPDCGHTIPLDVKEGEVCRNCSHAFWAEETEEI